MNIKELQELLGKGLPYETPADLRRSMAGRLMGWSDAWYYFLMLDVVRRGNWHARHGLFTREVWARLSCELFGNIEECGGRVSLEGAENLVGLKGPVVYVANHMSLLEIFLLPCMLLTFGDVTVIVKESLLTYPVFGIIMRTVEPIAVTRRNPREDFTRVMEEGPQILKRGRSILVFPQATRTAAFYPESFNTMGIKLAAKAGVPVVPVALQTDFQGIGKWHRDFGKLSRDKTVRLSIGKIMPVEGVGKDTHRQCIDFITGKLRGWGVSILAGVPGAE